MDYWLEHEIKPIKKETTHENYSNISRIHIVPELGKYQLQSLKRSDIQKMINKKEKYIKEAGSLYINKKIIFANEVGGFQHPDSLRKAQRRLFTKAGIADKIRIHDLRHSFASSLFDNDTDGKAIQMLLGHSTYSTTMNIYVKLTEDKKRDAIDKLNLLMKKPEK